MSDLESGSVQPTSAGDARAERLALRIDGLTWTTTEEGVVVLDVRSSRYLQLNRSGAVLWELLSQGATRDEMVAALCERFGIETTRAALDVDALIDVLRGRSLLE